MDGVCRNGFSALEVGAATPWNAPILNTYLPTSVEVVSCKPEVYAEKWAGMEVRASRLDPSRVSKLALPLPSGYWLRT